MSFYWGPNPLDDLTASEWKVQPQRFSQKIGVSGDTKTYQIIGIYRQSDLWDTADYRFLPNTVFVPNASLPENCYSSRNGVFFTYVLQNGKVSALQAALESQDTRQTFCFALITGTPKLLKPCMDSIAVRSSFFSLPAQQRARLCSYFLHCL